MLLNQNHRPRTSPSRQLPAQTQYQQPQLSTSPSVFYPPAPLNLDLDLDLDLNDFQDVRSATPSLSSSPLSQYSVVPQAAFPDASSIPIIAIPRNAGSAVDEISLDLGDHQSLMHHESWLSGHLPAKPAGRASNHHRESSLSSLGSTGPASPYNHNISNPHIAITDSASDGFHDLHAAGDGSWQYSMIPKSMAQHQDSLYTGYHQYGTLDPSSADMSFGRQRSDRGGLLPAPEFPSGPTRSHPGSVASSTIGGDSPATPSLGEPEDDRRRKVGKESTAPPRTSIGKGSLALHQAGFTNVPKFERTMTDVFSDELYSPNFAITSAPPSQSHLAASPTNELFAQRIQAANSQHLSIAHSPISATSRGHSPFRHGSPLAPTPSHDFSSGLPSRVPFHSAQRMREQQVAREEAQMMNQQALQRNTEPNTPQTISPKDSILEPPEVDSDSNFPLFPPQDHDSLYIPSQIPMAIQVPQQYPFIAHSRHNPDAPRELSSSSQPSSSNSSATPTATQKPVGTAADSGTYTCTYHGCTLRFDTPALLQKHKREGHRQAHGMNPVRRSEANVPTSPFNSQAGPHRCDRINPSTGKPCSTIFSRPYDLTRHEDTIHNARKQKVRCELCTEEKTFSRADALTRHFRVCHPDVEFPGKHRRRGGQQG